MAEVDVAELKALLIDISTDIVMEMEEWVTSEDHSGLIYFRNRILERITQRVKEAELEDDGPHI